MADVRAIPSSDLELLRKYDTPKLASACQPGYFPAAKPARKKGMMSAGASTVPI